MLEAAIHAGYVSAAFGLDPDTIQVRPDQLVAASANLKVFAEVFGGSTPELTLTIEEANNRLDGKRVAYVLIPGVRIGSHYLLLSFALVGIGKWSAADGGRLSVQQPAIRILERTSIAIAEASKKGFAKRVVRPMLERDEALLEREGLHVIRVREGRP